VQGREDYIKRLTNRWSVRRFAPTDTGVGKPVAILVDLYNRKFYRSLKKWARFLLAAVLASTSDGRSI
jgi:hypothetical protein